MGLVAHLVEIAGAGVIVVIGNSELHELFLVIVLIGVHELLENEVLDKIAGHILIQRLGVGGEFLIGGQACVDYLLI